MKKEEIEDFIVKEKIKEGVNLRIRTVCITATTAILSVFYQMGSFMYEKWQPLQAAFKAFIAANKP